MQANISVTPTQILSTTPVQYPAAGVPNVLNGLGEMLKVTENTPNIGTGSRMESFSVSAMPDNTAIIAYAAQDHTISPDVCLDNLQTQVDQAVFATRVYLAASSMSSTNLVRPINRATMLPKDDNSFLLQVDQNTYSSDVNTFFFIDGPFAGREYYLSRASDKVSPNQFMIRYQECDQPLTGNEYCVQYLSYSADVTVTPLSSSASSIASISPLPFITIGGEAVPSINPQVAVRRTDDPSYPFYVTVVAEAPVYGVHQLFMYGAALSSSDSSPPDTMYWRQLTFVGENRNARIAYDSSNTLHVVWQSSRCGIQSNPEQLFYGAVGPWSRVTNNEILTSAISKQFAVLNAQEPPEAGLLEPIVQVDTPLALNLTPSGGVMWFGLTAGSGTSSHSGTASLTVQGNPSADQFLEITSLYRDENGVSFSHDFTHRSFQVSFDLNVTMPGVTFTNGSNELEWQARYEAFKTTNFVPVTGTSFFTNNQNQYTIGSIERECSRVIPVVGAFKIPLLQGCMTSGALSFSDVTAVFDGSPGNSLRHFMLGLMPEKVTFRATNTQTQAEFATQYPSGTYAQTIVQEAFTGNFRLALLLQTSLDLGNPTHAHNGYKLVREFGPVISAGATNNFKIAVHYAHLPTETVATIVQRDVPGTNPNDARFHGDILVAVNDTAVLGETFFVNLTDDYTRFDLGFGCPMGGQVFTGEVTPENIPLYENVVVNMAFTDVAIGPHSMQVAEMLGHVSNFDRHVSTMSQSYGADEWHSVSIANELEMSADRYMLGLGFASLRMSFSQMPITFNGTNTAPSLCVDYCDRPHLVWQSNRCDEWDIFYSSGQCRSYPFRYDTRITQSTGNSLSPAIAVDKHGHRVIAWHDNRGGNYQIYAAKSRVTTSCDSGLCELAEAASLTPLLNSSSSSSSSSGNSAGGSTSSSSSENPGLDQNCALTFEFTNTYAAKDFHFRLTFYKDEAMTEVKTQVFSQDDIANWSVNGGQMPYMGVYMSINQTATVTYVLSQEANLSGQIYYVRVDAYDGSTFEPWHKKLAFYCPRQQTAKCSVPIVYTNTGGSTVNAQFRVTFYEDSGFSQTAYSASTEINTQNWIAQQAAISDFPSSGISVSAGETVVVVYDPQVLPFDGSMQPNENRQFIRCNAQYYTKVEVDTGGGFSTLATSVFMCACDEVEDHKAGQPPAASEWTCSGQGGSDLAISGGTNDALFASVAASHDGFAYLVWQDTRFAGLMSGQKTISPDIFAAVWDLNRDNIYSSAQQSQDVRVTSYASDNDRFYRPIVLVDRFMNPVFFFNNRYDVYSRPFGLSAIEASSLSHEYASIIPASHPVVMSSDEIGRCIRMKVYQPDVKATYYGTTNPLGPVDAVGRCFVRFEVNGPPGSRAIRLKNENDAAYSDWLPILPELPGDPTVLSADSPFSNDSVQPQGSRFEAYAIADDVCIVPWVLSSGSGQKTVCSQVLTYEGRTEDICINVLAAYDEFPYQIDFFYDAGFTLRLPEFNGVPVAGAYQPTPNPISETDPSSITESRAAVSTIYIRVTFLDPDLLDNVLSLGQVSTYSFASPVFTFDVINGGTTDLFAQPLTLVSAGVYEGSFPLVQSNGIEQKEGLGVIKVNVPDPRLKVSPTKTAVVKLDAYNYMSSPLSRYATELPTKAFQLTAQDIQQVDVQRATTANVTSDEFRELFRPDLTCTFLGRACTGEQPSDDYSSSSVYDSSGDVLLPSTSSLWPSPKCPAMSWFVPQVTEPFYYKNRPNPDTFVRESEPFVISLDQPNISGVRFGSNTDWDGILIMIKGNQSVVQSWSGVLGDPVTFVLPDDSIILRHSSSEEEARGGFFVGANAFRNASAEKIIIADGVTVTLAAGTTEADGEGNMLNVNPALLDEGTMLPNITTYNYEVGLPLSLLQEKGFVSQEKLLNCKFVHIVTGISHCVIDSFTCGHVLDEYVASGGGGAGASSQGNGESISSVASINSGDTGACLPSCDGCCSVYHVILSGSGTLNGVYVFYRDHDYCIWRGPNAGTFIATNDTRWVISISNGTNNVIFAAENCTICPPVHAANWVLISGSGNPSITLSETQCMGSDDGGLDTSSSGSQFCGFRVASAGGNAGYNETFDISGLFNGDSALSIPFTVVYDTFSDPDRFFITNLDGSVVYYDSGCISTGGETTATFGLTLADSPIRIQVSARCDGNIAANAKWYFAVSCADENPGFVSFTGATAGVSALTATLSEVADCGSDLTTFTWNTGRISEPYYWTNQANQSGFVSVSPSFSLNMSNSDIWGLQFSEGSVLDDVLVMMQPDQNIVTSWGGNEGDPATFTLPNNSILFYPNYGFFINGPGENFNASNQKTFFETGTPNETVIPAGANDGSNTGEGNAQNLIDGGFFVLTFQEGVSKADLQARGFIDDNGVLNFKFEHVVCGVGNADITGLTCSLTEPPAPPACSSPDVPGTLIASLDSGSGDVSLTWTDTSDGQASFIVQRCFGVGCTPVDFDSTPAGVTEYTDYLAGAPQGTYCYDIIAVTSCGESGPNNTACVDYVTGSSSISSNSTLECCNMYSCAETYTAQISNYSSLNFTFNMTPDSGSVGSSLCRYTGSATVTGATFTAAMTYECDYGDWYFYFNDPSCSAAVRFTNPYSSAWDSACPPEDGWVRTDTTGCGDESGVDDLILVIA